MATAKVCDRCGAVINPRNSGLYIIYGTGGYRTGEGEAKDLCCSCAFALKNFLADGNSQQGWRRDNNV